MATRLTRGVRLPLAPGARPGTFAAGGCRTLLRSAGRAGGKTPRQSTKSLRRPLQNPAATTE
eukprot:11185531-Lingulodinium_polyedra.AAC.1